MSLPPNPVTFRDPQSPAMPVLIVCLLSGAEAEESLRCERPTWAVLWRAATGEDVTESRCTRGESNETLSQDVT